MVMRMTSTSKFWAEEIHLPGHVLSWAENKDDWTGSTAVLREMRPASPLPHQKGKELRHSAFLGIGQHRARSSFR